MIKIDISYSGSKWWLSNNVFHRLNGPAAGWTDGTSSYQAWYKYGKCHRTNGPARMWSADVYEYWINDQQVTEYELMFLTGDING